jgi:hypothetical protein
MGQKAEWYWSESQQTAFESIKAELAASHVLCRFDLNRVHRVSADVNQFAVGAVLLQRTKEGHWQPVEYASRKLTETEMRYAMIEKEALAITWACEKFDYYLVGREFEIETDPKPLISILGEKDLSQLPLRVQRLRLRLMRYGYTIFHTPGSQMYLADSLSRPCVGAVCEESALQCAITEIYVESVVRDNLGDGPREAELRGALDHDDVARQCLQFMLAGWPTRKGRLTGELSRLYGCRDRLTEYEGLIMLDYRLYVPHSLRDVYLRRCHSGHQGIGKCRRRAQELFWWPSVGEDIAKHVTDCHTCIKLRAIKHEPVAESPLPEAPWREVGTDIFLFEGSTYLIMCDYYSKWIETEKLASQTASSVIGAAKRVFARFGVPERMRSDNGPCFACDQFRSFADDWGFTLITSSPRYPQSNGLAERAVGIVKRLWGKSEDRDETLLAYQSTPLSTGFSPGGLMFGRPMRSTLGLLNDDDTDYELFEEREDERHRKARANGTVSSVLKTCLSCMQGRRCG